MEKMGTRQDLKREELLAAADVMLEAHTDFTRKMNEVLRLHKEYDAIIREVK